jgi:hypothetical protein
MISTTWTTAPAGFLGLGGSDARPCAAPGTAVPFGGTTGAARLRTDERQAFARSNVQAPVVEALGVDVFVQKPIAPTTGTTLGIPSSRRPAS